MPLNRKNFNKLYPIPFQKVTINDSFWSNWQKVNRKVVIHHQYEQLEKANNINNFRVAANLIEGIHKGEFYYDSGVYKWLEAACYILTQFEDDNLKAKVNEVVKLILKSQLSDGYINSFYSINFIKKRFSNTTFMHELYCVGHLIQAAIAHFNATSSNALLDAADKCIDLIYEIFMNEKKKNAPGHQEIELALLSLYQITHKKKYFLLAEDLINRRGKGANSKRYIFSQFLNLNATLKEAKEKISEHGEKNEIEDFYASLSIKERLRFYYAILNGKCYQLHEPVRKIVDPVGHAVRAMYMFCGMADLYTQTGEVDLLNTLIRAWKRITKKKMYITAGIGSIKGIEGFEKDFKLRIKNSYSETCAAVGFLMWNWRMLQITAESKYADLIEKILYNSLIVGQSLDGLRYSYANPLISNRDYERQEWFLCACCPPNLARTIVSLSKYIYSKSEKGIFIHQYIGSNLKCDIKGSSIEVHQESQFPWQGKVNIKLLLQQDLDFDISLRIPQWAKTIQIKINSKPIGTNTKRGEYFNISRNWAHNDEISLMFEMQSQLIYGNPKIKDIKHKVAVTNGPLIYCVEQQDNPNFDIFKMRIQEKTPLKIKYNDILLGGVNIIEGIVHPRENFVAIPYYAWNNRGADKMQIWHQKNLE